MRTIRVETDFDVCRSLWSQLIPKEVITDLWELRECFYRHYKDQLLFLVVENDSKITGFLPLSKVSHSNQYGYFPGETWRGQTWIEQNRIIAHEKEDLILMLKWLDEQKISYHLRYLQEHPVFDPESVRVDEIGYVFDPLENGYDINNYLARFTSRKSLKSIKKDIQRIEDRGVEYRINHEPDFELMIEMNLSRFGEYSYFADERFSKSFRDMMELFKNKQWLQIVTLLVEGQPAAVDFGCLYNGQYTLLAGGTDANYLGVAKVINMYHLKKSCESNYKSVDFLCGDFSWKKIFQLTQRPLYLLSNV